MAELVYEGVEQEDTQRNKYLTFHVGREEYAIEIRYVTEIIGGLQAITAVPDVAPYVKGIINLRGKIIPVIDVNLRFGKEERDYNDRTCTIVVDVYDLSVGLIVDNVAEVLTIADEEVAAPPESRTGFHNRFIKGIGKAANGVKLLLDCELLLNEDDLEEMNHLGV